MNRLMQSLLLMMLALGASAEAATLWVEREAHHTAVIVAKDDLLAHAPTLAALGKDRPYVRFGWGDRDYYGASKRDSGDLLKALFVPTDSVLEVTPLSALPDHSGMRKVTMTEAHLQRVLLGILDTLPYGMARLERQETGGRDYYRAKPRYHLLANCNHWTARLLAEADVSLPYLGSTFSGPLMRRLDSALSKRAQADALLAMVRGLASK